MLPKKERLTTAEFLVVMEKGRVSHSPLFLVRTFKFGNLSTKFAAIAPKKVAKTAVMRNHIRRQIYEAIGELKKSLQLKGKGFEEVHVAVFAKEPIINQDRTELITGLEDLFVKAGIIK